MNGLRSSGEETWDWAGLVYWRQKMKAHIPCWRVWALFSNQWGVLKGFSAVECCKVFFWWMRLRGKDALKEANMEEQRNVNKARLCWELGEGQAQADGYLGNAQGTLWRPKGTKAVVMKAWVKEAAERVVQLGETTAVAPGFHHGVEDRLCSDANLVDVHERVLTSVKRNSRRASSEWPVLNSLWTVSFEQIIPARLSHRNCLKLFSTNIKVSDTASKYSTVFTVVFMASLTKQNKITWPLRAVSCCILWCGKS